LGFGNEGYFDLDGGLSKLGGGGERGVTSLLEWEEGKKVSIFGVLWINIRADREGEAGHDRPM